MKTDTVVLAPLGRTSRSDVWEPRPRVRPAYVPRGRALHLVALENLMGGPLYGPVALRAAVEAYRAVSPVKPFDHVIVATNPGLALEAAAAWPAARLLVRGGRDGADLALVDVVSDVAWTAARYDRIVVGSGDGIFVLAVASLRAAGVPVEVVSRRQSLSMSLAAIASSVAVLPLGRETLA